MAEVNRKGVSYDAVAATPEKYLSKAEKEVFGDLKGRVVKLVGANDPRINSLTLKTFMMLVRKTPEGGHVIRWNKDTQSIVDNLVKVVIKDAELVAKLQKEQKKTEKKPGKQATEAPKTAAAVSDKAEKAKHKPVVVPGASTSTTKTTAPSTTPSAIQQQKPTAYQPEQQSGLPERASPPATVTTSTTEVKFNKVDNDKVEMLKKTGKKLRVRNLKESMASSGYNADVVDQAAEKMSELFNKETLSEADAKSIIAFCRSEQNKLDKEKLGGTLYENLAQRHKDAIETRRRIEEEKKAK